MATEIQTQYDTAGIHQENQRLRKELRELTIQKNMMQYRLYRAMNKVLNTKKKKIKQLEGELEKLKKGESGGEADGDLHCKTCRCGADADDENKDEQSEQCDEPAVKKNRKRKQVPVSANDDDDASDTTQDPGSGYGSETDIDDEPASSKQQKTAVAENLANVPAPEQSPLMNEEVLDENEVSQSLLDPGPQTPKPSTSKKPEKQDSQKSDYDMEELMDEFCS